MPQTISNDETGQIIGGMFSGQENATKAVQELEELGVPATNIQVVGFPKEKPEGARDWETLSQRGVSASQSAYYDQAVSGGKILVVVFGVLEPAPIIDVFDLNKAEYNPDGSRNLRDDVAGMTVGAAIGATVGGVIGSAVAGPVGTAVGAAAGAVVGGGTGGAIGTGLEHKK